MKEIHKNTHNSQEIIPLALIVDEKIKLGASVCLYSCLTHLADKYHLDIRIIDINLEDETKNNFFISLASLNKPFSINYHRLDSRKLHTLKGGQLLGKKSSHVTTSAYAKLLLGDIWADLDKCIYLDCDIYANCDISYLYHLDTNKSPLWAAIDQSVLTLGHDWSVKNCEVHEMNPNDPCFNSGVLVLNLAYMRENDIANKGLSLAKQFPDIYFDQEIFNILYYKIWEKLDNKWNSQDINLLSRCTKEVIIHYAGPNKPWSCPYDYNRFKLFYDTLKKTPWSDWEPNFNFGFSFIRMKLGWLKYHVLRILKQILHK